MTKVLDTNDPFTYAYDKGNIEWEKAMTVGYDSLFKNHTRDLFPLPHEKNTGNGSF
jgi:hypothetical protein